MEDALGEETLPATVVDGFLAEFFLQIASEENDEKEPVIPGRHLRGVLLSFFGSDETDAVQAGMVSLQSEKLGSTKVQSSEPKINLTQWRKILSDIDHAMPPGYVSKMVSQRHFACCGDAALLVRALKPVKSDGKRDSVTWVP